jgi:predicted NUDIX family phosphoesterase
MSSEFFAVARQILESERRPMGAGELVEHALRHQLFSDRIAGKTPYRTMSAKLSLHIRRKGESSTFVRTAPGKFYLRHLIDGSLPVYEAPPLRKPVPKEQVLVFPSAWLDDSRRFQGILRSTKRIPGQLFRGSVCTYMPRLRAEQDNDYKQVLTYVLLTRGAQVLAFKRGNYSRVEDILRGAHCVGFGGHVSQSDRLLFLNDMGVEQCAVRELGEELKLPEADRKRLQEGAGLRLIGLLNDDSSEAGRRHFAFVYRYEVSGDSAWVRPERGEKSITQLRWLDLKNGPVNLWDFEYWSQLSLRAFFQQSVRAAPVFRVRRKKPLRPPHILCVLGGVGSGKSEATRILKEEFGYAEVNTGRLIADLMDVAPVPHTPREKFQELAWEFIQAPEGPEQLAEAIYAEVTQVGSPKVLVDGIRQQRTLECLQARAGPRPVGLLYVHTPPDLAYRFYLEREANNYSIFDFLRVRSAPVEREVEGMIRLSDAVLYNWTGLAQYWSALLGLLEHCSDDRFSQPRWL